MYKGVYTGFWCVFLHRLRCVFLHRFFMCFPSLLGCLVGCKCTRTLFTTGFPDALCVLLARIALLGNPAVGTWVCLGVAFRNPTRCGTHDRTGTSCAVGKPTPRTGAVRPKRHGSGRLCPEATSSTSSRSSLGRLGLGLRRGASVQTWTSAGCFGPDLDLRRVLWSRLGLRWALRSRRTSASSSLLACPPLRGSWWLLVEQKAQQAFQSQSLGKPWQTLEVGSKKLVS